MVNIATSGSLKPQGGEPADGPPYYQFDEFGLLTTSLSTASLPDAPTTASSKHDEETIVSELSLFVASTIQSFRVETEFSLLVPSST